eukprot:gb/GECG01016228.1/.p1 GENE.gb/GECG01016228.1/~~gb/GECG01016228.1/.p1  ORF type:complete len:263 (+),score=39.60 gb/GECG01016228.1/:1-789(+)
MTERIKSWFSGSSEEEEQKSVNEHTSSGNGPTRGGTMTSDEDMEKKAEELLKRQNTQQKKRGASSSTESAAGNGGADAGSIREMEHRLKALEIQNLLLWGTMIAGCGIMFARRNRQFRVKTLAADRILLTHPTSSMFEKPAVAAEMTVRQGRPEMRMLDGSVVLMDQNKHSRIQLDPSFRPAPAIVEPSLTAQKGMDRVRQWAGKPVLLFNREQEVPQAIMDANSGFVESKNFPRPSSEAQTWATRTEKSKNENDDESSSRS